MIDQERTDLKRHLMKVLEDNAGDCVANADSAALISAVVDATRAYAELDGPFDLKAAMVAELRAMHDAYVDADHGPERWEAHVRFMDCADFCARVLGVGFGAVERMVMGC